jgi:HEAT repeat protein
MRHATLLFGATYFIFGVSTALAADALTEATAAEQTLIAAGLPTDGASLIEFFRARTGRDVAQSKLMALVRQLGDPDIEVRASAARELVNHGSAAIPALRHAINDLDNAEIATRAKHCLQLVEGPRSAELPAAAARLIALRRPPGTAEVLVAYLPYGDDETVIDAVGNALDAVALADGKPNPALLKALDDGVPLRRALAGAALCRTAQTDATKAARKLLRDSRPLARLHVALALAERQDVEAISVLIDLLADLSASQSVPVEAVLQDLAGEWSPNPNLSNDDDVSRKARREAWAGWWRAADGPALLAEFRKHTLTSTDREKVEAMIHHLGDESFAVRELASADIVSFGALAIPPLRDAARDADKERARRAADCLQLLTQKSEKDLPLAAPRLLALRKPPGAIDALLDYAPFTDNEAMRDEIETALAALAMTDDKPDATLVRSLADKQSLRRALAAGALGRSGGPEQRTAVAKLLSDADLDVRFRAAMGLATAGQKDAVPALIELLGELPKEKTWRAAYFLRRAAADKGPALVPGPDVAANRECRDGWAAWWKEHGAAIELPAPERPRPVFTDRAERANAADAFVFLSAIRSAQERYQARQGTYCDNLSKLDIDVSSPKNFDIGTMTADETTWALTLTRKLGCCRYGMYTVTYTQEGLDADHSTIADGYHTAINPMADDRQDTRGRLKTR